MLEAVIFDIDGTIVDSVDFHANAFIGLPVARAVQSANRPKYDC